jgi:hypothetical protein
MTLQTSAAHLVASVKHTVKAHLPHGPIRATGPSSELGQTNDAPGIAKTQKAHLAEPQFPGQWLAKDVVMTGNTLAQVTRGDETTDPRLAHANDVTRIGGGVLIAALAGLCAGSATLASKEALGLVTWFGVGMSAAPLAINTVMKHTTGIDFGQHYITSYNGGEERERLLNNPEYLPTHLIPGAQQARFMGHEGIDTGLDTDAKEAKLSSAVQKRVIQHNTLWMLVAGPATAVATALTCHAIEPALEKSVPVALHWASQAGMELAKWTGKRQPEALEALAKRVAGDNGDSRIAQWWGDFGKSIVNKMGIDVRQLPVDDILHPSSALTGRNDRLNALAQHVLKMSDDQRTKASAYLTQQAAAINQLGKSYSAQADKAELKLRQGLLDTWREELPQYQHVDGIPVESVIDLNPDKTLDVLQRLSGLATSVPLPEEKQALLTQQLDQVAKAAEHRQTVQARLFDGLNTVSQYQSAINRGAELGKNWAQQSPDEIARATAEIRQWMERPSLPVANQARKQLLQEPLTQLLDQGLIEAQQKLMLDVGHEKTPSYSQHLARQLNKEQVLTAAKGVGATPLLQLDTAVKESVLKNTWRSRALGIAGGLGGATVGSAFALTHTTAAPEALSIKPVSTLSSTSLLPRLGPALPVNNGGGTGDNSQVNLTADSASASSTLAPLRLFNPTSPSATPSPSAAADPMNSSTVSTTALLPAATLLPPAALAAGAPVNPLPASSLVGVL